MHSDTSQNESQNDEHSNKLANGIPLVDLDQEKDSASSVPEKKTTHYVKPQRSFRHPPQADTRNGTGKNDSQDSDSKKATAPIPETISEIHAALKEKVGLGVSFDVTFREMTFGGIHCGFLYMNGFAKDTALIEVIKRLTYADEEEMKEPVIETFQEKLVAHIQVDQLDHFDEVIDQALAGMTALFIEGQRAALVMDARTFPARSIAEPDLERVVRGARDGFVETLMTNVTLIRRRLRDPRLKFEIVQVGRRTQTDVCIVYIEDIAAPELVDTFRKKVEKIDIDGIPLGEKQLEEVLVHHSRWNPYTMVRYSERPDVVASHLLEGHIVLLADTSSSSMILPCTMFQLMQHAEEYRQTPAVGTFLRWVRYFGIICSLFLLPLWYLLVANPELKPLGMEWIGPQEVARLPILLQFLIAELGVALMRMAAVHTPTPLATAMGLVAAILIGEIAVETGIFVNEVIMYMAVATIGMFATPSYELGMANNLSRIALLLATAAFGVSGLVVGCTVWLIYLAVHRSYNSPYLWPFIPFNAKALFTVAIRRPFGASKHRPSLTRTIDSTRQPT